MSVAISIENVVKKYDKLTVIPDLSIEIKNGEFFTLLGPSGCGKTTLLRMIAGFNTIEGGTVKFDGSVINNIPAHKRNIGMVFQNYAIFPHLTVKENVEYGLKLRKLPRETFNKKVEAILKTVRIEDYRDRLPDKLSGGQQQRVALARAIVIHPSVLLMDEPLSNLDAKLRLEMRSAIREIQQEVGITTVYVTHDQEEALAISDRIAVMKDGVIQQCGKPSDIYMRPANVFVSTFIGSSNLLKGKIRLEGMDKYVVLEDGYQVRMNNLTNDIADGQKVIISVRPEEFSIENSGIRANIKSSTFFGRYNNYEITFEKNVALNTERNCELTQDLGHAATHFKKDDIICVVPNAEKINVFSEDGEQSLIKGAKKVERNYEK